MAGPPAHQSPSFKPQTLDPQLSLQQFQVQGAGWRVNHHTPFRVFQNLVLGWLPVVKVYETIRIQKFTSN